MDVHINISRFNKTRSNKTGLQNLTLNTISEDYIKHN